MEYLPFPMDLLGSGLVWLGLAAGAFAGIIAFSNGSAWFGFGLAWFGPGAFHGIIAFSNGSAWFGVGNRRSHESDDEYSTVRRTCPQTIDHHRDIA